ncbi:peptidase U32 [Methanococcoides sp. SA1]|nr:peptidase U32 [Methanococcoides sp. SA1]
MNEKPELLAPAGTWDSFVAAVENGADAVYLGAKALGARAFAGNFTLEEIGEAVDYAHLRGVKVFVTVNTLVKDEQMKKAANMLCFLSECGADAVIVQDIGLLHLAKDIVPDLPIHASTQMTVHNSEGVLFLEELGVKRVVLAREMSTDEIRQVREKTNVELETFIHGALCISYSGQCLLSSVIGGRSGNRGQCAQPCRKSYELLGYDGAVSTEGPYLLSPKDLNSKDVLPQLIEAGVSSFKIEGRMKRPEYVAGVVGIYRTLIDRYFDDPEAYFVSEDESLALEQLFNRGFTDAYLKGSRVGMMSREQPYSRGLVAGSVMGYNEEDRRIIAKLSAKLELGDGIGLEGMEGAGENITQMAIDGEQVTSAQAGEVVEISFGRELPEGSMIFRTMDRALMDSLKRTFTSSKPVRKVPVSIKADVVAGSSIVLEMEDGDGNHVSVLSDYVVEVAQKRPTDKEQIEKQLLKLGNSVFEASSIDVNITGDVFIPIKQLNDVRNNAVSLLGSARMEKWHRPEHDKCVLPDVPCEENNSEKPLLVVSVDTLKRLNAAIEGGADVLYVGGEFFRGRQYIDLEEAVAICKDNGRRVYVNSSRIVSEDDMDAVRELFELAKKLEVDGVVVSNYGTYHLAMGFDLPVVVDSPLNVFNVRSYAAMKKLGAASVVLSPEMSIAQVEEVAECGPVECIVHGRQDVMISRYCMLGDLFGNKDGCIKVCEEEDFELVDELDYYFPLLVDSDCRMHVLNSKELCLLGNMDIILRAGVAAIRIEARTMDVDLVAKVTRRYRGVLDGKKAGRCKDITDGYTAGHYLRGVV